MRCRLVTVLLAVLLGATACGEAGEPARPDEKGVITGITIFQETSAEVAPDVRAGRTLLVDVRESAEWDAGRAPRALHVPLADVEGRLREIRARARGRPVAFICRTGRRSAIAARTGAEGGLPRVVNVDGGMGAWVRAGLPLVPRDGRVA